MSTRDNILLMTDVYKMSHQHLYPPKTEKIYSYLQARSFKKFPHTLFFGLRYLVEQHLVEQFPTMADVDELMKVRDTILGPDTLNTRERLEALVTLGYWPVTIQAVPEGMVIPNGNVLLTIENTHPDFAWVVGYLETMLLKIWNTCTVATASMQFRTIATKYAKKSSDDYDFFLRVAVHDFGARGVSSEETAVLSGMSHLVNFYGSDTVSAVSGAMEYYAAKPTADNPLALSVPASEHSVVCSFGIDNELGYFRTSMETYPSGFLSLVSDTWDYFRVLTEYLPILKDQIMARDGRVVIRPDGGDPIKIICGDPDARVGTPQYRGTLELLWDTFGGTINSKGYRVLDPHIGLIYGEGITLERYDMILQRMMDNGFATTNLVVGVGGLLLQRHNRDDLGFALKAVYAEVDGEHRDLMKNPATSPDKKSHKGRLKLVEDNKGNFTTEHWVEGEATGLLTYFEDGVSKYAPTFGEIRSRVDQYFASR